MDVQSHHLEDDDDDYYEEGIVIVDENSSIYRNYPREPWPFPAGPALDVMSIAIFNPLNSYSRIRGQITTTDYMKKIYYFYDTASTIKPGWNDLDLTDCPIAPVVGGHVKFQLTDIRDGVSAFDNLYDINGADEHQDGKFILQGDGNSGYRFQMIFTKTPFAVMARVVMFAKLASAPPCSREEYYYRLYGKITANKLVCFDIECGKALRLEYGCQSYVPTYRNVYAVPVNSALAVEVELHNRTRCIMTKELEFKTSQGPAEPYKLFFNSEDDCFDFGIRVEWSIHEDIFCNDLQLVSSSPDAALNFKPFQRKSLGALVEVFSVFSGRGNSSAPCGIDLYGAFVVFDGDEKFNILARNKDCPDKLLSSSKNDEEQFRTLSLKWPDGKWIVGEKFKFYVKLKDVGGKLACVGESSWSPSDTRYDCRLCDVYKDYSVFKNGKKAEVSIDCCNGPYSIYGSVFAKYKDYDYSSRYDEQCYQSVLFKRSKEDALEVTSSQMCLLKSQVSAPSNCDELIVCVDLWVRPLREPSPRKRFSFNTNNTKSFPHKRFIFNTNDTKSCDMVWGTRDVVRGRLNVKVDWV